MENKTKIKTVINYCSNDRKFLIPCVEQARKFSEEVIVVCFDHLFDGTPENVEQLKHDKSNVMSLGANFLVLKWFAGKPTRYYHNMCRYFGYIDGGDYDWILFLDVDEIVEGDKFNKFVENHTLLFNENSNYDLIKLANYWYFINSDNRWSVPYVESTANINEINGDVLEDSAVMIKSLRKDILSAENFFMESERQAFCDYVDSLKSHNRDIFSHALRRVVDPLDNTPFVHHYSWVRNKEEMLTKVKTWGHNKDRNWISAVNEQFKPENLEPQINDVIFMRKYRKVEPLIIFNN